MKKLISLALMVCLCLSLGVAANAEEGGAYVCRSPGQHDI